MEIPSSYQAEAQITRRNVMKALGLVAAAASASGLGLLKPRLAFGGNAAKRPIADFLVAQGTTSIFVPPVPDYVGWGSAVNKPPVRFALVDYAGLANKFITQNTVGFSLGTKAEGSVIERPLADGRAEVTVILHTTNALTWVMPLSSNPDFLNDPLLFGFRAQDIVADTTQQPGLAECHLMAVFTNTAPGAPLPDLVNAFILGNAAPGQELIALYFYANATGPLRATFGVPEGTPGRAIVSETGVLFRGPFKGATADGFPVEQIELRVVGQ